jgi:hypothetical protein
VKNLKVQLGKDIMSERDFSEKTAKYSEIFPGAIPETFSSC